MERLDQGNLHLLLEVLICPGRESNPASGVGDEHSSKELFEHLHEPTAVLLKGIANYIL